jgi:hypothetical protein
MDMERERKIDELLTRGVAEVIDGDNLRERLIQKPYHDNKKRKKQDKNKQKISERGDGSAVRQIHNDARKKNDGV